MSTCPLANRQDRSGRSPRWRCLALLLALTALVSSCVVLRAAVPARDAVRNVQHARQFDLQGLSAIREWEQYPLFPIWTWCVHQSRWAWATPNQQQLVEHDWARSVQLAATVPLVLAVIPLFLLLERLYGLVPALAGGVFYAVLPEVTRLSADGLGDGLQLLFFLVALCAVASYLDALTGGSVPEHVRGRVASRDASSRIAIGWAFVIGMAIGLSLLVRLEAVLLLPTLAITMVWLVGRRCVHRPQRLIGHAAVLAAGLLLTVGPYWCLSGKLAAKQTLDRWRISSSQSAGSPTLASSPVPQRAAGTETYPLLAQLRLPDGSPAAFPVKETSRSSRSYGLLAALAQYLEELPKLFSYWIGALVLWGCWRVQRSNLPAFDVLAVVWFLLFSTVAVYYASRAGYLSTRHLLLLIAPWLGCAGVGAHDLGRACWRAVEDRRKRNSSREVDADVPPKRTSTLPAYGRSSLAGWIAVALVAVACLPATLRPAHAHHRPHRQAGQWLAQQAGRQEHVLDTRGWTALYSGRETYTYQAAREALVDPRLAYVVIEQRDLSYDSQRARTLAWMLRQLAEPCARFDADVSAGGRARDTVLVFRWHPVRLAQRRPSNL